MFFLRRLENKSTAADKNAEVAVVRRVATKSVLFQEQSETFRTGSHCPATTWETLSGDQIQIQKDKSNQTQIHNEDKSKNIFADCDFPVISRQLRSTRGVWGRPRGPGIKILLFCTLQELLFIFDMILFLHFETPAFTFLWCRTVLSEKQLNILKTCYRYIEIKIPSYHFF